MSVPPSVPHQLKTIENKLQAGRSLSPSEIELARLVIQWFESCWKSIYREQNDKVMAAQIDKNTFLRIFKDMYSTFSSLDDNTTSVVGDAMNTVCDYCDENFPLLNNDFTYSYQMHTQTPVHMEAIDNLKMLHPQYTWPDALEDQPSGIDTVSSGTIESSSGITKDVKKRQPSGVDTVSSGTIESSSGITKDVKKRSSSQSLSSANQSDGLIVKKVDKSGKNFCILCKVELPNEQHRPLRDHLRGRLHLENLKSRSSK